MGTRIVGVLIAFALSCRIAAGEGIGQAVSPGATAGLLQVVFLDVGQGDAILVSCPDGSPGMIVDSGDVPNRVPEAPQRFQEGLHRYFHDVRTIPLVVATHPHSDHIGNLAWVLSEYEVLAYLDNGQPPLRPSNTLKHLESAVRLEQEKDGMNRLTPDTMPDKFPICGEGSIGVQILGPHRRRGNCSREPNNCSVVLRLDYGGTSFLLTGDVEHEGEARLLADETARSDLDVDVLKVAHHGSESSTTGAFLGAVTPKVAVISAGPPGQWTNRTYRHPRSATVNALLSAMPQILPRPEAALRMFDSRRNAWTSLMTSVPIYVTASDGNVIIRSDGEEIILPEPRDERGVPAAPVENEKSRAKGGAEKVGTPGGCVIKGNINSKGDRIYHVPGGSYYESTRIDPSSGEKYFCTQDEAERAGWRRSRR